ncbi:signal peptidase I [Ruminococcus sp.]|uniref:signal peptidase I n=1 Tax=Ruminococcus sp. TaxID=41978 RepID=UPI0025E3235C|nr:signal peptidase I [Ruminococcus sp.]MBQ8965427.1 signal peptidase I [Ruminococcus sp.]
MNNINKGPPSTKAALIYNVVRKVIICILCAGMIVAAILFVVNNSPEKNIFGFRHYTVLTPSMEPAYKVGDMVVVRIEGADKICVGDVITFVPSADSKAYLTHRVTQKLTDYQNTGITCFRTKGDANNTEDSFLVDEDRVIGKVSFSIPKLGYIIRFVQLRWYYLLPLAFMLWLAFRLMSKYFDLKNDSSSEESTVPDERENNVKE